MVMKRLRAFSRNTVAPIAMLLSFGVSSECAQDSKSVGHFGWFGVGEAHLIEAGHSYWVGEFSGTLFSQQRDHCSAIRAERVRLAHRG